MLSSNLSSQLRPRAARALALACLLLTLALLATLGAGAASGASRSRAGHAHRVPARCSAPNRRRASTHGGESGSCTRLAPARRPAGVRAPRAAALPGAGGGLSAASRPGGSKGHVKPPSKLGGFEETVIPTPPAKTVPTTPPPTFPAAPPSSGLPGETPAEGEGEGGGSGEAAAEAAATRLPSEDGEVLGDPIDPHFLTDVPFGSRSFWVQPWRAYIDTLPASRLQEALGANFPEGPAQANATAQLLQDSGFKLARIGINWDAISYSEPSSFRASNLASITTRLTAMREHGLRPLIVLDANSDAPAPLLNVKLETLSPAPAGAQTVTLSPASAAQVLPGKTGFDNLSFGGVPDILITSDDSHGLATLSRPLLHPLPAGAHGGATLRYAPFQAPTLANGSPNPVFQETLSGWLSYVRAVSRVAGSIVGPGGYDLEVWNELTFSSQFLNAEHYYSQSPLSAPETSSEAEAEGQSEADAEADAGAEAEGESDSEAEAAESSQVQGASAPPTNATTSKRQVSKLIRKALLSETVAFVRNPANGILPAVGITDGFASQTPFPSGADAPAGLTALSKHPYTGPKEFPAAFHTTRDRPVNAEGLRDTSSRHSFTPLFIPTYQAMFPEYWLTDTSTETLIRDLAPFTTYVYGFPHGREVAPAGATPVQKWITEFNLGSWRGSVMGPDEVTPQTASSAQLTPADRAHFQAKVALRSLVSNVNKGITREYFFTAAPGSKSLVSPAFFSELAAHPGTYPGDAAGGETMSALHSMLNAFQGPGPGAAARQLSLSSITQEGDHAQFAGDGTTAHPSLYDRNVLAVLPFQSSPTRFVIPVYVMTQDMLTDYLPETSAGDVHRFDLPSESFKITLGNLPETTAAPSVSAYDPLLGEATPARLVSREGSSAVFEFAATDYPRLLTIEYPGG